MKRKRNRKQRDRQRHPRKYFLTAVKIFGILYLTLCLALWHYQSKLIFFPNKTIRNSPANLGLLYEEVQLPVGNGTAAGKLHGWWIPTLRQRANQPAPTILYLHGNGSNIGDLLNRAAQFHQLGYNILLFDYRGYGLSTGPFPNEQRVYEDAEAAWGYLTTQLNIPANHTIIYGRSLGGAIALNLATHHPNAAGTITEATFTTMKDMVTHQYAFFPFPTRLLLTNHFESLKKVRSLTMPLLFMHGTADKIVPSYMSQQLHQAATQTIKKNLLLIESGDHNNLPAIGGDQYANTIRSFIDNA
ncbi:MAG: alpha/beta hydrolase [Cyanobacteria bacterium J06621_11]